MKGHEKSLGITWLDELATAAYPYYTMS